MADSTAQDPAQHRTAACLADNGQALAGSQNNQRPENQGLVLFLTSAPQSVPSVRTKSNSNLYGTETGTVLVHSAPIQPILLQSPSSPLHSGIAGSPSTSTIIISHTIHPTSRQAKSSAGLKIQDHHADNKHRSESRVAGISDPSETRGRNK